MGSSYPYGATDPTIYDVDPSYGDDDHDSDCDHTDGHDMDVCTGRCQCDVCGHAWYADSEQVNAELDRQAQFYDEMERENRRQWWRDQFGRLAFWRRWRKSRLIDDDLPF